MGHSDPPAETAGSVLQNPPVGTEAGPAGAETPGSDKTEPAGVESSGSDDMAGGHCYTRNLFLKP